MNSIVLSIHPKYVEQIFSCVKKYEYRTRVCSKKINKIYIYETYPTMMVVGEVEVLRILKDIPENIWNMTSKNGCINKDDFYSYFKNRKIAYAYELGQPTRYEKPKLLMEFGIKAPPQSFIYV